MMTDLGINIGATEYGNPGRLVLKGWYAEGGVALQVVSGRGVECTATVNLVDSLLPSNEVWLKGWGENAGVPEALEMAGAVRLTGRTQETGRVHAQHAELLFEVPS